MPERLIHDTAWNEAHALLSLVAHNFPEKEHKRLFSEFYNTSRAALEALILQSERERRRITPSNN